MIPPRVAGWPQWSLRDRRLSGGEGFMILKGCRQLAEVDLPIAAVSKHAARLSVLPREFRLPPIYRRTERAFCW